MGLLLMGLLLMAGLMLVLRSVLRMLLLLMNGLLLMRSLLLVSRVLLVVGRLLLIASSPLLVLSGSLLIMSRLRFVASGSGLALVAAGFILLPEAGPPLGRIRLFLLFHSRLLLVAIRFVALIDRRGLIHSIRLIRSLQGAAARAALVLGPHHGPMVVGLRVSRPVAVVA